jgi:hypothetical protein
MSLRKAAEMAVDALMGLDSYKRAEAIIALRQALNVDAVNMSQERVDETAKCKHESVAWMMKHEKTGNVSFFSDKDYADAFLKTYPDWTCTPLYAELTIMENT